MTREEALIIVNKAYVGMEREHFHWKLINNIYDDFDKLIIDRTNIIIQLQIEAETLEQRIAELEVQLADANSYFDGIRTELLANKIKES